MTPTPSTPAGWALALWILATPAAADVLCVETSGQLDGALIFAELHPGSDEIRIRSGSYLAPEPDGWVYSPATCGNCFLEISGGWSANCTRRSGLATDTVLVGRVDQPLLTLEVPGEDFDIVGVSLLTVTAAVTDVPFVPGAVIVRSNDGGSGPDVQIDRVIFRGNRGVALYVSTNAPVEIVGSLFDHNLVTEAAGASVRVHGQTNLIEILNNTFTANDVDDLGIVGGLRVETTDTQYVRILNNIFWGNENADVRLTDGDSLFSYNDYGVVIGSFLGAENLQVDPLFADPSQGDYRLRFDSPMVDSGDDSYPALPIVDLDRTPRPQGFTWDRGAFEHTPPLFADGFESGSTSAWSVTSP